MTEIDLEDFEQNLEQYLDEIETGEEYLVRLPDGRAIAAVPVSQDIEKMVDIMPEYPYNQFDDI